MLSIGASISKLSDPPTGASVALDRVTVPPLDAVEGRLVRPVGRADDETRDAVARIIEAVRTEGDTALVRFSRELDDTDLTPDGLEVPSDRFHHARAALPAPLVEALEVAADRIRTFHERQREAGCAVLEEDGTRLGTLVRPLERVGVCVPGGRAVYPSSVLMSAIPARVAGVGDIVGITPPGGVTDVVLAACGVAGVTRLFRVGGAHGVAALAFGTETLPRVDKIVGPGSRWVAEAKRQLVGVVGIDGVAGPTEIVVIADGSAAPARVAADLLAQVEHDEDATAWLITTEPTLVDAVERDLARRLVGHPRERIARTSLDRSGLAVIVPDIATALEVADRKAPEHLALLVHDAATWAGRVRHAGAVFVGDHSPEPVGDYLAGPSHVLPTGGTARFASPLGVYDFVKRTSVIEYSAERLRRDAEHVITLAEAEGLRGHADAVRERLDEPDG